MPVLDRRRSRASVPGRTSVRSATHFERITAILVTITALWMAVHAVTHAGGLWRDEVSSVNTQHAHTLSEMWRLQEFDSFPLLWSMALRGWMACAGDSDGALRLFGLFGIVAIIAALWLFAWRMRRGVPLIGLALVAMNPEIVRWGSSVRAWGTGAALGVVAVFALWEMSVRRTRQTMIIAVLAAVASVQCVYQNSIVISAAVVALLVVSLRRRDVRFALPALIVASSAALSLLPYAGLMSRRAEWNALAQIPLTPSMLAERAASVIAAGGIVGTICWTVLVVLSAGVILFQRASKRATPRGVGIEEDVALYAGVVVAVSLIGYGCFYLWFRYFPQAWYFMGAITIAAAGLDAIVCGDRSSRPIRTGCLVATLSIVAMAPRPSVERFNAPLTNSDAIASVITSEATPGDLVVVNPWYFGISLTRYYRGQAPVVAVPPIDDLSVHRYDLVKAAMLAPDPMSSVLSRVQQVLMSNHHVWYIGAFDLPRDGRIPPLRPPPLADSGWLVVPYQRIWSSQLSLFLNTHARFGRRVAVGAGGGDVEEPPLNDLSGWR